MSDSKNHYVVGVTFSDDSVFLGTTTSDKPLHAAKKIYQRVKSDISKGKQMESKLQLHLSENPHLITTADPFVHQISDNTVDANETCNAVLDQLKQEGWNVLTVQRKSTTRV